MRILIIGQTSLHWGRMEFGNIGNYYIIEPFVRELHRVFPSAIIKTTLQMSDDFCNREKIVRLPMELYYSWEDKDYFEKSIYELGIAEIYNKTNELPFSTPYIEAVLKSDLVIDFSGDIWGDNADFLGKHRFIIGLIKDRVAQLLGKKTAMLSGSPGPFKDEKTREFAKIVYKNFDIVTNRENISSELMNELGFDLKKTYSLACPAFLFEPKNEVDIAKVFTEYSFLGKKQTVGFILCGWNLLKGPFDRWPLDDEELMLYVNQIEQLINTKGVDVFLLSHSNGFELPPNYKLIHGRDFPFAKQLYEIITKRKKVDLSKIHLQKNVLNTWETKAVIKKFDMLISGRIHGAVAGMSQFVPTVIIDYGHEPKAHKLRGFAKVVGMEYLVADPSKDFDLQEKINYCFENLELIRKELKERIPKVKTLAMKNFDLLKSI
ncbi:MAG: polysaccharide pyruvyl transferase family protein [Bacteroidales bacterium]|nr:polysaccharide pyruvyl transferase family protein [Bacteroidales bacterium]